ncbi:MAG: energy transducer TonB [Flavobacteriales bacterium]|nr:energy transducer TonB [Flavobacteriales bacterium]
MTKEQEREKRNKILAIVIAALLHIASLLIFWTIGFEEPDPPIEEKGLPLRVRLGTTDVGQGTSRPSPNPVKNANNKPKANPNKNIASQNDNPTAAVNVAKGDTINSPDQKKEQEQKEEQRQIDNNLASLLNKFKTSKDGSDGGGNDDKPGDKGKEYGINGGADDGGPNGSRRGNFVLAGRDMLFAAQPPGDIPEEGTVAVEIWVDKAGKVIRAVPGIKGSNTNNSTLFEMARKAALKTKFSSKPSATEVQKGVIYYHFKFGY